MSAERGAGANTLAAYRRDLVDFAGHLCRSEPRPAASKCGTFWRRLSTSGMAASTQARKLSGAAPVLTAFCMPKACAPTTPPRPSPRPRRAVRCPRFFPASDLDGRCCKPRRKITSPEGLRLSLIVEMLYGGGLRVSELAGLKLAAVRTHEGIHPRHRQRQQGALTPLNVSARAALDAYLAVRGEFLPEHDKNNRYLFVSRGAEGFLTRRRFHQLLKGLALKAASIRPRSRRMCCVMPSPPIWWKAARTCAASRPCWAMPISPPPRSIPMWRGTI